ncbi:unnamed protein product [Vitrella brassicaformis CCMP3155]|uniref:Uncharacterized protein n=1 Tax=Vitrella brassicaformis (strain CCMP3155) TaxID=1169540 RepID=A0A0G4F7S3_VITBC|nr:unnamed protein product [Vitrella brassicaformis CCMP3155]|eukprot:CEM08585.1 unnamed protein product [Vitrella brassicaformis CCMP3155]
MEAVVFDGDAHDGEESAALDDDKEGGRHPQDEAAPTHAHRPSSFGAASISRHQNDTATRAATFDESARPPTAFSPFVIVSAPPISDAEWPEGLILAPDAFASAPPDSATSGDAGTDHEAAAHDHEDTADEDGGRGPSSAAAVDTPSPHLRPPDDEADERESIGSFLSSRRQSPSASSRPPRPRRTKSPSESSLCYSEDQSSSPGFSSLATSYRGNGSHRDIDGGEGLGVGERERERGGGEDGPGARLFVSRPRVHIPPLRLADLHKGVDQDHEHHPGRPHDAEAEADNDADDKPSSPQTAPHAASQAPPLCEEGSGVSAWVDSRGTEALMALRREEDLIARASAMGNERASVLAPRPQQPSIAASREDAPRSAPHASASNDFSTRIREAARTMAKSRPRPGISHEDHTHARATAPDPPTTSGGLLSHLRHSPSVRNLHCSVPFAGMATATAAAGAAPSAASEGVGIGGVGRDAASASAADDRIDKEVEEVLQQLLLGGAKTGRPHPHQPSHDDEDIAATGAAGTSGGAVLAQPVGSRTASDGRRGLVVGGEGGLPFSLVREVSGHVSHPVLPIPTDDDLAEEEGERDRGEERATDAMARLHEENERLTEELVEQSLHHVQKVQSLSENRHTLHDEIAYLRRQLQYQTDENTRLRRILDPNATPSESDSPARRFLTRSPNPPHYPQDDDGSHASPTDRSPIPPHHPMVVDLPPFPPTFTSNTLSPPSASVDAASSVMSPSTSISRNAPPVRHQRAGQANRLKLGPGASPYARRMGHYRAGGMSEGVGVGVATTASPTKRTLAGQQLTGRHAHEWQWQAAAAQSDHRVMMPAYTSHPHTSSPTPASVSASVSRVGRGLTHSASSTPLAVGAVYHRLSNVRGKPQLRPQREGVLRRQASGERVPMRPQREDDRDARIRQYEDVTRKLGQKVERLKQELIDRTEKANATILQLAKRNKELRDTIRGYERRLADVEGFSPVELEGEQSGASDGHDID